MTPGGLLINGRCWRRQFMRCAMVPSVQLFVLSVIAGCSRDGPSPRGDVTQPHPDRTEPTSQSPVTVDEPVDMLVAETQTDPADETFNDQHGAHPTRPTPIVLQTHKDRVTSVACSADGKTLAIAVADGTIGLWSIGEEITHRASLEGHECCVYDLDFSPDAATLVSGGGDMDNAELIFWDVASASKRREHEEFEYQWLVGSVAYLAEGKTVAASSLGGVSVIESGTGTVKHRHHASELAGDELQCAYSAENEMLAFGETDGVVRLRKPECHSDIGTIKAHFGSPRQIEFSPDGKLLATAGGYDRTAKLWTVANGKRVGTLTGHDVSVLTVAFSPDGKMVATGGGDKAIKLWSVDAGKLRASWEAHEDAVNRVVFLLDGRRLVSVSNDKTAKVWQIEEVLRCKPTAASDNTAEDFPTHGVPALDVATPHSVRDLDLSPDGRLVAAAMNDMEAQLYDTKTGEVVRALEGLSETRRVSFSPDGKRIAVAGEQVVGVWDVETGEEHWRADGFPDYVASLSFGGDFVAAGGWYQDTRVKVWHSRSGELAHTIETGLMQQRVMVAVSKDGKLLAVSDEKGNIVLRNPATGERVRVLEGIDADVHELAFSDDGRELVATYCDTLEDVRGRIRVWDTHSGRAVTNLHDKDVTAVWAAAFLSGIDVLAWGTKDGVTLWDVDANREIRRINKPFYDDVVSLAYSADGRFLAAGEGQSRFMLFVVKSLFDRDLAMFVGELEPFRAEVTLMEGVLHVDLNDKPVTDDDLALFKRLHLPYTLNLEDCENITDVGLSHLANDVQLRGLNLHQCEKITDGGLMHLAGAKNLESLNLHWVELITDEGMKHLSGLKQLKHLDLDWTEITNKGLAHLAGLTNLERLCLPSSITDEGMVHLAGMTKLVELDAGCYDLTDEGLAVLANMPHMKTLRLGFAKIEGPGLVHVAHMTDMRQLDLDDNQITDDAARHLERMTKLERLVLPGGIGDAGFAAFADMTELAKLQFGRLPEFTGSGLDHLKRSKLTELNLSEVEGLTDEGMAGIGELTQLTRLSLPPQLTTDGLVHLHKLTNLESLWFNKTQFDDEGFRHIAKLKSLRELCLNGTKSFTGKGLRHFSDLMQLTDLHLDQTAVTDEGLIAVSRLTHLKSLTLSPQNGDEGLVHLKNLNTLEYLHLHDTKVTDDGLAHLEPLVNLKLLSLDRTAVTDAGLEHIKNLPTLETLGLYETKVSKAAKEKLEEEMDNLFIRD